jgi:hypothetical protein
LYSGNLAAASRYEAPIKKKTLSNEKMNVTVNLRPGATSTTGAPVAGSVMDNHL